MNSSWDSWETEVSHSEWASQTHRSPSSQSWSNSHPAPTVHSPQPTGGSKAMRNFLAALEYLMLPYKRSMDSWRTGIKCHRGWWPQFTGISHLNELEWGTCEGGCRFSFSVCPKLPWEQEAARISLQLLAGLSPLLVPIVCLCECLPKRLLASSLPLPHSPGWPHLTLLLTNLAISTAR